MPLCHFGRALQQLGVTRRSPIAIAASGGADSTALLSLAADWAQSGSKAGCQPLALIVDHNLRKGSAEEAQHARKTADLLGLRSKIYKLKHSAHWPPANKSELLSEARQQRYLHLYQECCSEDIPVLLTGHHADDQAENFLIRLSRASGLDGLAGIEPLSYLSLGEGSPEIKLIRPLIHMRKQQLQDHCHQRGLTWVEDPTNQDRAYLRNLIRAHLADRRSRGQNAGMHLGKSESMNDSADIVKDVLLLSKVCSAAKQKTQQEADVLLDKVVELCADQFSGSQTKSIPTPLGSIQMSFRGSSNSKESLRRQILLPGKIDVRPLQGQKQSIIIRVLAQLFRTDKGLPPKSSTLHQAWKALRSGALLSPHGKVPKRLDLQGCFLQPIPKTSGKLVHIIKKK